MKETKQILVVRKDLNMRKGKIVAQTAHASLGIFTKFFIEKGLKFKDNIPEAVAEWLNSSFKKVCVYVNSEEELLEIYNKVPQEIPKILITDSGKTEFNNIPTHTCIAIGPWWSEDIDKITGNLPLL